MDRCDPLEGCPIIAAVNNDEQLERCFGSGCEVVFLLYGDLCSIANIVHRAKAHGRFVLVHIDLVSGLAQNEVAVDFIKQSTEADGIISTKPKLIKRAKELGLFTVMRIFMLDSRSLRNVSKQLAEVLPDVIEILPGLMHKITRLVCSSVHVPVVAGGLITDKEDITTALAAGAVSISTTCEEAWFM